MDHLEKRAFKTRLYTHLARLGKALANPHRLELLELLAQGERRVEHLARELDLSIANASQHLQVLAQAGLLESRREATAIYYRPTPGAFPVWQALRDLAQDRLPDIEHLLRTTLERDPEGVTLEALRARLETGRAVLLDVRPTLEFNAGHIPGAMSAPITDLETILPTLSKRSEIIAYCRGPYCVFADEAVAWLRARGFDAQRLELGLPDWQAAGYPVTKGMSA
jgi:rhodanese-related sulfurtransferase